MSQKSSLIQPANSVSQALIPDKAFFQKLSDLGWTPGRNISIEYRFADNNPNQLPALVKDLVRLNPDAIYVPTRPALPAVREVSLS